MREDLELAAAVFIVFACMAVLAVLYGLGGPYEVGAGLAPYVRRGAVALAVTAAG